MSENEKYNSVSTFPIEALVAIVERETLISKNEILKYGHMQSDPMTKAYKELCERYSNGKI